MNLDIRRKYNTISINVSTTAVVIGVYDPSRSARNKTTLLGLFYQRADTVSIVNMMYVQEMFAWEIGGKLIFTYTPTGGSDLIS